MQARSRSQRSTPLTLALVSSLWAQGLSPLYTRLLCAGLLCIGGALTLSAREGLAKPSPEPLTQKEAQKEAQGDAQKGEGELKPSALTREMLLSCVRGNNPAWEMARADLESARAKLSFAQASALPKLKVSGMLAPLPARRMLDYCVSEQTSVGGRSLVTLCPNQEINDDQRLDQVDGMGVFGRLQVTVEQPLYTFGKLSSGRRAAREGVKAYQLGTQLAEQRADLLAFEAFYGLQLSESVNKSLKEARSKLKGFKEKIERDLKAQAGKYTSDDLRRMVIQEADLTSKALEVEALTHQALKGIRVACHLEPQDKIKLASKRLRPFKQPLESEEALWEHARVNRYDLNMARAQVLARQALVTKAFADLMPNLGVVGALTYSVGTSADDHPDPFANDPFNVFGYGVYLGLSWSVGVAQVVSKPREARAALQKARAQLKGAEQLARLELNERYEQAKRYEGTLKARKEAMRAAKALLTSTFFNMSSGLIETNNASSALSAYLKATTDYDQVVYEYNLALARVWRAAGYDLATHLKD